jgi:hypothetical protein
MFYQNSMRQRGTRFSPEIKLRISGQNPLRIAVPFGNLVRGQEG